MGHYDSGSGGTGHDLSRSQLRALIPPGRVLDKMTYPPWTTGELHRVLAGERLRLSRSRVVRRTCAFLQQPWGLSILAIASSFCRTPSAVARMIAMTLARIARQSHLGAVGNIIDGRVSPRLGASVGEFRKAAVSEDRRKKRGHSPDQAKVNPGGRPACNRKWELACSVTS